MSPSQPLVLFQMLHSHFRANALYCLLAQAKCSLMVQEKQMPLLAALVFLLDSLYHELKVCTMYCKHSVKFFKKNIKKIVDKKRMIRYNSRCVQENAPLAQLVEQ